MDFWDVNTQRSCRDHCNHCIFKSGADSSFIHVGLLRIPHQNVCNRRWHAHFFDVFVGHIIPTDAFFFFRSRTASTWLLLGDCESRSIPPHTTRGIGTFYFMRMIPTRRFVQKSRQTKWISQGFSSIFTTNPSGFASLPLCQLASKADAEVADKEAEAWDAAMRVLVYQCFCTFCWVPAGNQTW